MSKTRRAQPGDRVRVQYLGLLTDGAATKRQQGRQVLEFTVGSGEVMRGISHGVVGMAQGERKQLTLQPHDAYGAIRSELIREIPRQRFRNGLRLYVGQRLVSAKTRSNRRQRVKVIEIKSESIVVDGNHPLAGKVIEVEFQLVSLDSPSGLQADNNSADSLE